MDRIKVLLAYSNKKGGCQGACVFLLSRPSEFDAE